MCVCVFSLLVQRERKRNTCPRVAVHGREYRDFRMVPKIVPLLCRGICDQFDEILREDEREQTLWAIIRGSPSKECLEKMEALKVIFFFTKKEVFDGAGDAQRTHRWP